MSQFARPSSSTFACKTGFSRTTLFMPMLPPLIRLINSTVSLKFFMLTRVSFSKTSVPITPRFLTKIVRSGKFRKSVSLTSVNSTLALTFLLISSCISREILPLKKIGVRISKTIITRITTTKYFSACFILRMFEKLVCIMFCTIFCMKSY